MFTTDEDQKQHLEKEAHGQLRDEETTEEKQEKLNESHPHHIWQRKCAEECFTDYIYILKQFNWSKS